MFVPNGSQGSEVREKMRGGNGRVTVSALVKEGLPKALRLYSELALEPGSSIGYHVHEGETEIFHILAGQALCMDDSTPVTLNPGDVLVTSSGHGHSVESTGSETLRMIACIVLD